MIDQTTIQQILDAAEIADVVGEFVTLKRRGTSLIGLCPFHNEKTPSFNVSQAKGIYKCFGCSKGGSSVNFIMEHEHLSYTDALRWLAKKYNIDIREKEAVLEKDAANLSQRDLLAKRQEIEYLKIDFDRKKNRQHEDFLLRKQEELNNFQNNVNSAVTSLGQSEGYDLILYNTGGYIGAKVDVTDKVLKILK